MTTAAIPTGFHTITPYLIVEDVGRLLTFLETAMDAEIIERMAGPDGSVNHAQVRIGDSRLMMGCARGPYPAMPTMLYLYVEDCDAMYTRALDAGAQPDREPQDEFYGDRTGGVVGPCGNKWWFATHIEDVSPEECARRAAEAYGHA